MADQLMTRQETELAQRTIDADLLAGQVSASTISKYTQYFRQYSKFAVTKDAALKPETLARWRNHMAEGTDFSPNYINTRVYAVKRIMKEAAQQGLITQEVALHFGAITGVKVKAMRDRLKQDARTRISADDMRRLIDAPDTQKPVGLRDRALLLTLATSGMRISELCSLRRSDIETRDRGYVVMVLGKNQTEREAAPISTEAVAAIDAWLETRTIDNDHVFTSFASIKGEQLDQPISHVGAWKLVQKYAKRVGLKHIKPHDFRRFVGTQLAAKDLRTAQKALRHADINTTARFYVLDELEAGLTDNLF